MLFNSFQYLFYFLLTLAGYALAPKNFRHIFLFFASMLFYMAWNPQYAVLMLISISTTWICALFLEKISDNNTKWNLPFHKKLCIISCLIINLGILFFFKYCNFFTESLNGVFEILGIHSIFPRLDVLLPIGISFYTFQAIGYIIDVYRGEIRAERNFCRYALFISFFPQLVAGPIERSRNMQSQIKNLSTLKIFQYNDVFHGVVYVVWGVFMKMVIADRAAILVDTVYNTYWNYNGFSLSIATVLFALQIYCDFASYSAIAIGCSRIMGIRLMENFNAPYLAPSISDFWRRWHISLSTWFRDYLYFPLGGSRKGDARTYINLMIVFVVSGLWHGANWTFILWGAVHGVAQVIGRLLKPIKNKINEVLHTNTDCFSFRFGQIAITFSIVCFAWIFFRAKSIQGAFDIIGRVFTRFEPWSLSNGALYTLGLTRPEFNILMLSTVALILVDLIRHQKGLTISQWLDKQNTWFKGAIIIILIMASVIFGEYGPAFDPKQFIYFQF